MMNYNLKDGNGKVKEYESGNLIFEGEYLNGKRNGKGKGYFQRKLEFEGEYYNGKRWNGKGYHKNGNIKYEVKDGKRIVIDKNYIYDDGEFEIDLLNRDKNGIEKGDNFAFKMEGELFQYSFPFPFLFPFKYLPSNIKSPSKIFTN